ncbi:hypothetical protein GYMLUDRAFT_57075 [Collybiopsis luxurians FD-317 M1]|uniref:DUF659 domain-containing protein n=1 Tax=Collybiopsis luxurians FD-317 M1 TaxID=944289 RepID=A0A0D0CWA0_9AGAR|nr:hypothetical protein GYMLUDRAFT_57075 [Collybiopsis luxurians FD-317 M1]
MANALIKTLKEYGIEDKVRNKIFMKEPKLNSLKIISITCNNASANTAMLDVLEVLLSKFLSRRAHVQCMAHTVNLMAKGILHPFEPVKPKSRLNDEVGPDPDFNDNIGLDELYAELKDIEENGNKAKDDIEGFVEVLEEMTDAEREKWDKEVEPVKNALYKT